MRYVRFICLFFAVVLSFGIVVCAEPGQSVDSIDESTIPLETSSDPQIVIIDPSSIQDIADALLPTEPIPENTEEPTAPMIDISPDSISALADAIVDSMQGNASASVPELFDSSKHGYYFTCNCAFQENLTVYVPVEFSKEAFSLDDSGDIVNMTLKDFEFRIRKDRYIYVISAPSMSGFTYHIETLSGSFDPMEVYDFEESIIDSNISFLRNTPQAIPDWEYWSILLSVIVLFGSIFIFWRRY